MVTAPLHPGTVLPLVREVTGSPDPLALYRALSEGGRSPGTVLLESAETGAGSGERGEARAAVELEDFDRAMAALEGNAAMERCGVCTCDRLACLVCARD